MRDKHKTMVVFRVWKDSGDVIALFPCWKVSKQGASGVFLGVMSYEHVGQHGSASYIGVMRQTRAATPEEAIDLADELKDRGYKLAVRQRRPGYSYEKKWLEMRNS